MFNRQLRKNVKDLDVRIGRLYAEISKDTITDDERKKLLDQAKELTCHRNELSEVKARESLTPAVLPAVAGLVAIFMVIRHEETNVITTKALGFATKMFRGQ
jgi:hypothetical protein